MSFYHMKYHVQYLSPKCLQLIYTIWRYTNTRFFHLIFNEVRRVKWMPDFRLRWDWILAFKIQGAMTHTKSRAFRIFIFKTSKPNALHSLIITGIMHHNFSKLFIASVLSFGLHNLKSPYLLTELRLKKILMPKLSPLSSSFLIWSSFLLKLSPRCFIVIFPAF